MASGMLRLVGSCKRVFVRDFVPGVMELQGMCWDPHANVKQFVLGPSECLLGAVYIGAQLGPILAQWGITTNKTKSGIATNKKVRNNYQ